VTKYGGKSRHVPVVAPPTCFFFFLLSLNAELKFKQKTNEESHNEGAVIFFSHVWIPWKKENFDV
jgi:hypothetical protein